MATPIITLTSDFGTKDHFVSTIKGRIFMECANAKIIDITHQIPAFSVNKTAYIVKNTYKNFPKGTIHIIAVDAEWSIENEHLLFLYEDHFFICADNGIMSLVATNPHKIIKIPQKKFNGSNFFLSSFVDTACKLANGEPISSLGEVVETIKTIEEIKPYFNDAENEIKAHVIYIDHFGNLVCNVTKASFEAFANGRKFVIKAGRYEFTKIHTQYNAIVNFNAETINRNDDGKQLALFNSDGFLELAIYRSDLNTFGGASSLLGLKYRDRIKITFS